MKKKKNSSILEYLYPELRWMKKKEPVGWKPKETH